MPDAAGHCQHNLIDLSKGKTESILLIDANRAAHGHKHTDSTRTHAPSKDAIMHTTTHTQQQKKRYGPIAKVAHSR